jgi:hypothetical protein
MLGVLIMSYVCKTCGNTHEDLPDVGFQYPDHYFGVPEIERESRIKCSTDLCVINNEHYFIRGVILIPIHNYEEDFGIGVWVSLNKENYEKYEENPNTSDIGPFFGWLCNSILCYDEETQLLKTMVHFQSNGQRPMIDLEPCGHKLYQDYSQGISVDEAWEMAHRYYPADKDNA